MTILQIHSSIRGEASYSSRLAHQVAEKLLIQHPTAQRLLRDLAKTPQPLLDESTLQALLTPEGERSSAQTQRLALDEALIAELQQADHIVIAAPMYNFAIPAQLKAWIDAVSKAGVTFRYTEQGPQGLLSGKQVYVIQTSGGVHSGTASDTQTAYLHTVLGFLGLTDVRFIYAEGLAMGPDAEQQALHQAQSRIDSLFA